MSSILLVVHSAVRWLVLLSLTYAIWRGVRGWSGRVPFTAFDNRIRHLTATIAHLQLMVGYTLYFSSPLIRYFRSNYTEAVRVPDFRFFGLIHVILMTLAIVLITIGSAAAKRKPTPRSKFRTMTGWYVAALVLIFLAVPWPFSPLANRPYFRSF
ncbi:hypothetical protein [Larkinella soli]|uniref:hypothetical protein n=1 Tax=Larkinella soli TaxID=1770527 RepID=UPI000FFB923E|nr:hypothetical protein [Larkinella soli]